MRFDDLRWFGIVTWYPDERELHFNEYEPWSFDSNEIGKEINRPADDDAHILFEAVRGDDGEFVYIGENVDKIWWYFIDTWIYDGIHTYIGTYYTEWQPDKLLEVFCKSANFIDGVEVNNSLAYANEHILLYINGKKVGISDVRFDPTGNIWAVNIYFDIAYISLDEIQSITLRIE